MISLVVPIPQTIQVCIQKKVRFDEDPQVDKSIGERDADFTYWSLVRKSGDNKKPYSVGGDTEEMGFVNMGPLKSLLLAEDQGNMEVLFCPEEITENDHNILIFGTSKDIAGLARLLARDVGVLMNEYARYNECIKFEIKLIFPPTRIETVINDFPDQQQASMFRIALTSEEILSFSTLYERELGKINLQYQNVKEQTDDCEPPSETEETIEIVTCLGFEDITVATQ
jgi:hypothetical protein